MFTVVYKTGTWTGPICFLLCQSISPYRPRSRSRSRAVSVSYKLDLILNLTVRFKNRHLIKQKEKEREAPDWAKLTMYNPDPDDDPTRSEKPVSKLRGILKY